MFANLLLVVAIGLTPIENVATDTVDVIEVNHYYDEHGELVFDQLIFWDWRPTESRYHVRAWRLLRIPQQFPIGDRNGFSTTWHDWSNGHLLRQVRSQSIRETWTQYDPELIEREMLSEDRRRELMRFYSPTTKPEP